MHFFISQDNPTERIPGQLTKQQEAEKTVDQVPAEKKFLNISYFDLKMIVIASAAMVFSIICGKTTDMKLRMILFLLYKSKRRAVTFKNPPGIFKDFLC